MKSFWLTLSLLWVSHFVMDFMLGVWSVYKTMAGIDLVVAGLIASLSMFIGEGSQLCFGYLSDRGYRNKLSVLGMSLTATIPFLCYVQNEYLLFLMVLTVFMGSGAFHPSGSDLVLDGSSSNQSSLIAFFACGGMAGGAVSQIGYAYFYERYNGHTWFLVIPVVLCILGLIFCRLPTVNPKKQKLDFRQTLKALQPLKFKLGILYIIAVLIQTIVISFTFLLSDILKIQGYEQWFCLGGGYFCFILGSALMSVPVGYCIDKFGFRKILVAIVCTSACALYLFLQMETLSIAFPIFLLMVLGGTLGIITPVATAGGIQGIPVETRSFVMGIYMGGTACIGGLGPLLAGVIASYFEDQAPIVAIQYLSSLYLIALPLIYFLPAYESIAEQEKIEQMDLSRT